MTTTPERQREHVRRHYKNNPQYYKDKALALKSELGEIVKEAKDVPCMDCGNRYPSYVMDFDHRDPGTKLNTVASMVSLGSKRKLFLEIAKCDVVCSNCHRERTFGQS